MKLLTVLGARPQFVKAGPLSQALRQAGHQEIIVHTGQHYDPLLSEVFFEELELPRPDVNLGVGSASHGVQTGRMLAALDPILHAQAPDWVLVYGDTNSTLAGALSAAKLGFRLAHVEAGLRSRDRGMPEELNRILADHAADLLLCPTETAVANLRQEGLAERARLVGDLMLESLRAALTRWPEPPLTPQRLALELGDYVVVTLHRPINADRPGGLRIVLECLLELGRPALFLVHPRTRPTLERASSGMAARLAGHVHLVEPVGYREMLALVRHAAAVLTDSGGLQKEAYFLGVPCVTLRSVTEWPETLADGWNELAEPARESLLPALQRQAARQRASVSTAAFGDGRAAQAIVRALG